MKTLKKIQNGVAVKMMAILFLMAAGSGFGQSKPEKRINDNTIRPFHTYIPENELTNLRQRINATRWPEKETVINQSQGVKLEQIQQLVQYWGTSYDWRKAEAKLNALPQFVTQIDGLDIHFIHVKSKRKNAMPLIITHGWPGSVFELLKVIDPLTNPTAYGGKAEDAFDVVIPSMPGYGFSEKPKGTGWGADRIGLAWDVATALKNGDTAPLGLSAKEQSAFASLNKLYIRGGGYAGMMVTRPQTLGYGLTDSPVGLASFFLDKFNEWTYSGGNAEKSLTKDEMLDDISLYWITNTAASSAQLYWENNNNNFNAQEQKTAAIKVPVAITVFPGEIYQAPKSWAERSYKNLIYFNEVDKGGHFASWEEPLLFAQEMRAAFRSL